MNTCKMPKVFELPLNMVNTDFVIVHEGEDYIGVWDTRDNLLWSLEKSDIYETECSP